MIADVVNLAIMSMVFCQAAGRLILLRGLAAGIGTGLTQGWIHGWTRWKGQYREPDISALTGDSRMFRSPKEV